MAQFVQLQKELQAFHDAGIGIVALTYDAPLQQQEFIDKNRIDYPFLSDINAYSVTVLGILNEKYQPGDDNYGIPHPGIFILDPSMKIVGKIFIAGYERRVNATAVLAQATELLHSNGSP